PAPSTTLFPYTTLFRSAADGAAMRRTMAEDSVDLVLFDLGLFGEDGLIFICHICVQSNVGVIIVTGSGESVDRSVSLELGADDLDRKSTRLNSSHVKIS